MNWSEAIDKVNRFNGFPTECDACYGFKYGMDDWPTRWVPQGNCSEHQGYTP